MKERVELKLVKAPAKSGGVRYVSTADENFTVYIPQYFFPQPQIDNKRFQRTIAIYIEVEAEAVAS